MKDTALSGYCVTPPSPGKGRKEFSTVASNPFPLNLRTLATDAVSRTRRADLLLPRFIR